MSSIIYFLNELKQSRENFHKLSCPHPPTYLPQGSVFSLPSPMSMLLSCHSKEHHPLLHLRVQSFLPLKGTVPGILSVLSYINNFSIFLIYFIYLFTFGCAGPSFLCELSSCGSWALEHMFNCCGTGVSLLCSMWALPRSGIRLFTNLYQWFFTTEPPEKPQFFYFY